MGFPVRLAQSLYTQWPSTANAQQQLQKLTTPTDFSLQWQNNGIQSSARISVRQTLAANGIPGVFQISGFSPDSSTITYGSAQYKCSGVISIVQNQHTNFTQSGNAQYEMILAFQITNKDTNPSSPDIILLCRPIAFQTSGSNTPFWNAVDVATTQQTAQTTSLDMSSFFGFNSSTLMPMITYQTCIPAKVFKSGKPYTFENLRVRVNVVPQPINVVASETGLGKCSTINKYTLITSGNGPVDIFGGDFLQFRDGLGPELYPSQTTKSNLVISAAPTAISAFADILQTIEILVPEAFLGRSLSDIANAQAPPPVKPKKKAFKCYTIDPTKDIVGDQIMVDPTTGQSLKDTMRDSTDMSDNPVGPDTKYYTLYGDDITGIVPVKYTFPVINGPIPGLNAFVGQDGSLIRYVIAPLDDVSHVTESGNFPGNISGITSLEDLIKLKQKTTPTTDVITDTGKISINEVTISGAANAASSGIMPGDIEHILTLIATIIGTVLLLAYLGFIVHSIIFRENGFHDSLPHVVGFTVCFIGLVLFSVYVEKPTE